MVQQAPVPIGTRAIDILNLAMLGLVFLVLLVLGIRLIAGSAVDIPQHATLATFEYSAYTNVETAHVTITNLGPATRWTCIQAKVQTHKGGGHAQSVVVCSGDMKPHTTVNLEPPYHVGTVRDFCSDPPNQFGARNVNWDLCTFDVVDAPTPGTN